MKRPIIILSALILLISCGKDTEPAMPAETRLYMEDAAAAPKRAMGGGNIRVQESSLEQKVIRSASLGYEVNRLDSSLGILSELVSEYKGILQQEQQSRSYNRLYANLTVRVPAEHFDAFIEAVLSGDDIRRFEEKNISAQDVTEQFIDIESRLETKRQALARYRELLQKAETVADMITVEDKIRYLQEEIESQQARLDYLSGRVLMSEVNISIYETLSTEFIPDKSDAFFPQFMNALHNGWQGIVHVFFWLVGFWPIWLVLIIILIILKTRRKGE